MNITSYFVGNLPDGFELYEDLDFYYLYYRGKKITSLFLLTTEVEDIEKIAQRYVKSSL
ncbi:MAG: hypothetical protein AB7D02_01645 [Candidatus Paceibacterota bacterium]